MYLSADELWSLEGVLGVTPNCKHLLGDITPPRCCTQLQPWCHSFLLFPLLHSLLWTRGDDRLCCAQCAQFVQFLLWTALALDAQADSYCPAATRQKQGVMIYNNNNNNNNNNTTNNNNLICQQCRLHTGKCC